MSQTSNIAIALESSESQRLTLGLHVPQTCTDTGQKIVQNMCNETGRETGARPQPGRPAARRWPRFLVGLLILGVLGCLFFFSLRLAGTRVFQIDEFNEVYVGHVLSSGAGTVTPLGNFGLFEIPLSWLVANVSRSMDALVSARLAMVQLFWLNIILIALATGARLLSIEGLVAIFGAATLAPLWDYGFEVRHDNPLLTGLLLMWCF